jgi:2'-5' RNA ligase
MPNRNSYIGVCFNDAMRHALSELQEVLAQRLAQDGIEFDPMELQELHMTFFFAGEQLHALKADTLTEWHAQLTSAVMAASLSGGIIMRLSSISCFPPGKSNLLVACFDVPSALHDLQRAVEECSRAVGIAASSSQRRQPDAELGCSAWVPHVTLGKVRASREAVKAAASTAADHAWTMLGRGVDEGLGVFAPVHGLQSALLAAPADGLMMCGDPPKQVWLDWRETLRFR